MSFFIVKNINLENAVNYNLAIAESDNDIINASSLQGINLDSDLSTLDIGDNLIFDGNQWTYAPISVLSGITGPTGPTGGIDNIIRNSIIPDIDNIYELGSLTKQFRTVYIGSNTVFVGGVPISSTGGSTIILPTNTAIDGVPIGTIKISGVLNNTSELPTNAVVGDSYIIGIELWVAAFLIISKITFYITRNSVNQKYLEKSISKCI